MTFDREYVLDEPSREAVNNLAGASVLEFGNSWCGYCRQAEPLIEAALSRHRGIRYIRIADGRGRPLGRSFGVKLWPTLVFIKDGVEVSRLVRPHDEKLIAAAMTNLTE